MKTNLSDELANNPGKLARVSTALKVKGILTATDFSDESRAGVRYALALAEKVGASVSLVYVVEPPSPISGMEAVPLARSDAEIAEHARMQLQRMADRERGINQGLQPEVRRGKPYDEITKAARERGVDVIVIATHGHSGAKRIILGSTAERVVRHAGCPVLTVPAGKKKPFRLKKVVVPIDFSKVSKDALPWAISLGKQFEAEIILLHVVQQFPIDFTLTDRADLFEDLRKQAKTDLDALAAAVKKSAGIKVSAAVREGTPYDRICDTAQKLDADLIVLTTHGYTGLKHLWLGSTAERVVRHAPCPVLAVRKRTRQSG